MRFPEVNLNSRSRQIDAQISSTIYLLLGLIFFFPYLILFKHFNLIFEINWNYFFQSLLTSFQQSAAVVLICGISSVLLFRSLYIFNIRWRKFLKNVLIIPMLLPSIFTILIALAVLNPFPFGFFGVVLIFVLIYFGFFYVSVNESIESKLGEQYIVKEIYGISIYKFYYKILWPQIRKDFFGVSLIVFIGCFSSLSVPLIASGGRSVNFELFIYETIFINNNWSSTIILALIQAGMLLIFGLWMRRFAVKSGVSAFNEVKLKSIPSFFLVCSYLVLYFGALFGFTVAAFISVRWDSLDYGSMFVALCNSMNLFFFLALAFSLLLFSITYLAYRRRSVDFFKFFLTPSSIIVGFAYYLFFTVGNNSFDLVKMVIALFTVYSFGLYFNFIAPQIDQLEKQIFAARSFNIDFLSFFRNIFWPQMFDKYFICLSVLLLIALTDFAVIKAVGAQTETLGTFIYNYLSSYRLQWAFVFVFFTLILWFGFLSLMRWGFHVFNKKSDV